MGICRFAETESGWKDADTAILFTEMPVHAKVPLGRSILEDIAWIRSSGNDGTFWTTEAEGESCAWSSTVLQGLCVRL